MADKVLRYTQSHAPPTQMRSNTTPAGGGIAGGMPAPASMPKGAAPVAPGPAAFAHRACGCRDSSRLVASETGSGPLRAAGCAAAAA